MIGAGRYGDLCTLVRKRAKAKAAIVIVFEGTHGAGFSIQGPVETLITLPKILRTIADEIESDQRHLG